MKARNLNLVFLLSLGFVQVAFAQAPGSTAPAVNTAAATEVADIMTLSIGAAVLLILAITLFTMARANQYLSKRVLEFEAEKNGVTLPTEEVEHYAEGDDFWTRMRKKYWEDAVPLEKEGDITMGHAYDGIRELDNKLPPWWVNMFILTIIWAVGYMYYYHWSDNDWSSKQEYETELAVAKKEIAMALAGKAASVDESSVTALTDAASLGEGALIYKNVCAACHGMKGEGTVGPNFADEYWIHGGGIKNIFKTIKYGVPEKGMISWQAQLKPTDMQKVASYILTLQGTNPPNPKDPQGEIWKDTSAVETTVEAAVEGK